MKMKRPFLLFLPFLLFVAGAFVSCEEVEEAGKYDNWRELNEAFADSIKALTGENYVATAEQADAMELGKLYAIQTTTSTTEGTQYVYCKKLVKNEIGERPLYTGYHSTVSAFYYGTLISGDEFWGNFDGYSALEQHFTELKEPTEFDSPNSYLVYGNPSPSLPEGWTAALQLMRVGERWIIYMPYRSGYGSSDYTLFLTIPAYSTLTYDLILRGIE